MPNASILGCAGPRLEADEAAFFRAADPWGFILFARNIEDPAQLARLTAALRASVGRAAPILIDQEGGRVQRMAPPHWAAWPPAQDQITAAGAGAARVMWLRARLMAADLRAVGIDVNCAPLADIATPQTHPFLRNRLYGTDADSVARIGRAVADGLLAGGVLPVLKHIPGHGRALADSHHDLPLVEAGLSALHSGDFAPFRALRDLPMAMTAHIIFTALDPDAPVTTSPRGIAAIRGDIGFGGLLMSDDISMNALSGSIAARSAASIAAGCDLVLHCNGDMAEMAEVVEASGAMGPAATARAEAALACRRAPAPIDIAALRAELDALSAARDG